MYRQQQCCAHTGGLCTTDPANTCQTSINICKKHTFPTWQKTYFSTISGSTLYAELRELSTIPCTTAPTPNTRISTSPLRLCRQRSGPRGSMVSMLMMLYCPSLRNGNLLCTSRVYTGPWMSFLRYIICGIVVMVVFTVDACDLAAIYKPYNATMAMRMFWHTHTRQMHSHTSSRNTMSKLIIFFKRCVVKEQF